jgi:DALR anticodon binding domain/Arginyl tRNA synthetase N terminal domain
VAQGRSACRCGCCPRPRAWGRRRALRIRQLVASGVFAQQSGELDNASFFQAADSWSDWCPRQDSNLRSRLRRAALYPLSYGGVPRQSLPYWPRTLSGALGRAGPAGRLHWFADQTRDLPRLPGVIPAALAELVRSLAHDVLTGRGLDPAALPVTVTVRRPRDPGHGDYMTNVALQTGKKAGVAPREFASDLALALALRPEVRSADVAGPGFLNLRLAAQAQGAIVAQVLADGAGFGALEGRPTPGLAGLQEPPSVPVPVAQYAHARLAALARHAADLEISWAGAQLELLEHEREGELIRTLGEFPRIGAAMAAASTAKTAELRRLARYLEQLSSAYHRFEGSCRVLPMGDEQPGPRHAARLALCQATRQVLANGLGVLGLSAPERM